jgi:hypothetical protein
MPIFSGTTLEGIILSLQFSETNHYKARRALKLTPHPLVQQAITFAPRTRAFKTGCASDRDIGRLNSLASLCLLLHWKLVKALSARTNARLRA